jgi:hypothetical protein
MSSELISDALSFGRLRYGEPNAVSNAKGHSRSHHAVIRIYDAAGNVIETHEQNGPVQGVVSFALSLALLPCCVIQPLSGPAGLGDHGKPRVSQLQPRCSQAAKYAP